MLRFFKTRLLILAVFLCGFFILLLYFGASAQHPGVPVLNYHQINDVDENVLTVSTPEFETQMRYLKENGYTSISPYEYIDHLRNGTPLPEKPVILAFDDGYKDNAVNAVPILQKYGMKGTIFIVTDFLDRFDNYISWADARALERDGTLIVESHTMSHSDLSKLSEEEIRHEFIGSRLAIYDKLGKWSAFIAYPGGKVDERIPRLAQEAGFYAGFTVRFGLSDPAENLYLLDRIPVFGCIDHSFLRFRIRLLYAPLCARLEEFRLWGRAHGLTDFVNSLPIP
ncbi:hypothetical protein TAMA11512_04820 [Selenomonas sp. TAMA-11512]|uniref:polysaccharide deacetylase family protein n=1 Tax=Selenomonas sp. TAMA-11512 TaxID=3095337 RepID=UPI003084785E|nr:hypothetical protein TAMA11512_04820 [Selenomonas sp. TAMA-11512]